MEDKKKISATCGCYGFRGHVSTDCYYRMREVKIKWKQLPYHKPGSKPFTWKEQKRVLCTEDKFEKKALEISLGLQAYIPNYTPSDANILKPA
jgi:hypothetical protein